MMILSRNKGISNYYEICDVELSGGYEEKMLVNNQLKYLPEAEIRTLDNKKSIYVKVDGFSPLSHVYGRCVPDSNEIVRLIKDIRDCIKEIREYLLNPSGLVLNMKYILYDDNTRKHCFIYIPKGNHEFTEQIKLLFEEIMRMFDKKDREGVVLLYDLYSKFLVDNFSPELFCKIADEIEKEYGHEEPMSYKAPGQGGNEVSSAKSVAAETHKRTVDKSSDISSYKSEEASCKDDSGSSSLYLLATAAAVVTSIVLYILFGSKSFKFTAVLMSMLIIYIVADMMHRRNMDRLKTAARQQINDTEYDTKYEMNTDSVNYEIAVNGTDVVNYEMPGNAVNYEKSGTEINYSGNDLMNHSISIKDIRESTPKETVYEIVEDTSVLVNDQNPGVVSRLVPCGNGAVENIYLIEGETKIGRQGSSCDYCINEPSVSRVHAILEKIGNHVLVRDAGSTNGTFINEERIDVNHPVEALFGDMISFAGVQYECR